MSEQGNNQEKIIAPRPASLAPIEHFLRGGVPSTAKVTQEEIEEILNKGVDAGKINDEDAARLLTPLGLSKPGVVEEDWQRIKNDRAYSRNMDVPYLVSMTGEDGRPAPVVARLELGTVSGSNKIRPSWSVEFFDTNGRPLDVSVVNFAPGFDRWFDIQPVDAYKKEIKLRFV